MRALSRVALALLACATAASAEPPPLPAPLEGTVVDGEFQPGDLGWLRGRFADATEADTARLAEVKGWLKLCAERATADERADLLALQADASQLSEQMYGEPACAAVQITVAAPLPATMTFEQFVAARTEVQPIVTAWLAGATTGAAAVMPYDQIGRPIAEAVAIDQAARKGLRWNDMGGPALPEPLMAVVSMLLGLEMDKIDRASTAMLRDLVQTHGWPTVDGAGKPSLDGAWLLVQHADHDPAWQVTALRLLQPLAASGQVSASNTAYLTDRVQVNLTGRQTYGTQFHCVEGHNIPRPIDDEAEVDARRASAGIGTLADYKQLMAERFGDRFCPPATP